MKTLFYYYRLESMGKGVSLDCRLVLQEKLKALRRCLFWTVAFVFRTF